MIQTADNSRRQRDDKTPSSPAQGSIDFLRANKGNHRKRDHRSMQKSVPDSIVLVLVLANASMTPTGSTD